MVIRLRCMVVLLLALPLVACGQRVREPHATQSFAWSKPEQTPVARLFAAPDAVPEGQSGFYLLNDPREAFRARYALATQAQHTLDLQYYLWKGDLTGRLLLLAALNAADRGVRVRVLIDDIYHAGRDDLYALLTSHRNFEVRVFNPIGQRGLFRYPDFVTHRDLNHRMHNKIFLVDNAVAVLGGRNIGDDYFGVDPGLNFVDLDSLAAGPVAREAGAAFDLYWNSAQAVSVSQLQKIPDSADELARAQQTLKEYVGNALQNSPYQVPDAEAAVQAQLGQLATHLTWARAKVVVDPLERFDGEDSAIARLGAEAAQAADHSITVETAYLLPPKSTIKAMKALVDRGVALRLMTNSLMSNNHTAVHGHYARRRKDLLKAGVQLYELRADAALMDYYREHDEGLAESNSGLHAKAMVVDDDLTVIGSYNMDPRSRVWNSEIALVVYGQEFARQTLAVMNEEFGNDNAYRVFLNEDGEVRWRLECEGCDTVWSKEPDSTFGKRFMASFFGIMPIGNEL